MGVYECAWRPYLLVRVAVLGLELLLHECARGLDIGSSLVVREVEVERHCQDLVREQVSLVEEQDHAGLAEPAGVADLLEQVQRLHDAVRVLILVQHLIVLADRGDEQHGSHVLEAVDPKHKERKKERKRRKTREQQIRA